MTRIDNELDRREFLQRAARLGAAAAVASQAGWLGACGGSEGGTAEPDTRSLAKLLEGRVLAPGQPGYTRASHLFNPRFDDVRPKAVAYLESREDVRRAIGWARENEVPIVARNGGHSYGGYSTSDGLVADLTRMKSVEVDRSAGTARVAGGSLLIDVYATLARHGVTIPAGSCPTVGISGLTLGGGIGLSGRKLGLTCDNLLEVEMVTADGEVVTANERDNPDLFWASRGGGGGNFGIVTDLEFRVHPVGKVAIYNFEWPWRDARAVFDAWQRWAPQAPDELFSICKLQSLPSKGGRTQPSVTSFGQFFGAPADLETVLEPLLRAAAPSKRALTAMPFLQAQVLWAGCESSAASCVRETKRAAYMAKSDYVTALFSSDAVDTMVRWIEKWPGSSSPSGAAIQMDASGGAINRVPEEATAFIHRDDLFHCQYLAYWDGQDPSRVVDANLAWIGDFYADMRPFVSGFAYQNYIDPDLDSWEDAYYGDVYQRLQQVNETYDPANVFSFDQAVS
jgi:FAD/FMN-containing dehydrogenase